MCGLVGLIDRGAGPDELSSRIAAMSRDVAHRGPDGEGVWIDEAASCALAHRRLAVIDLSSAGAQPMRSANRRYVIVFNGEIYNYQDLRARLRDQGVALRGASDTEALLECWARFGPDQTLALLQGMFAFAVWDQRDRKLTLVRDRVGIKPILWSFDGAVFRFASELRALRRDLGPSPPLNGIALDLYLHFGVVPAPHSIDPRVHKLEPGRVLTWHQGGSPDIRTYWDLGRIARQAASERTPLSGDALIDELEERIVAAVETHMVSDVPVGAFLSGGVDSSIVISMMRRTGRVRSFTVGFDDPALDESGHAQLVANALGTEHTTIRLKAGDAVALAETVANVYDEPFADASQIPTTLLCRAARQHVKVALSGDGGDEGFAGYARYGWVQGLARYRRSTPGFVRAAVASALRVAPTSLLDQIAVPLPGRPARFPGQKLRRMGQIGAAADHRAAYTTFLLTSTEHCFLAGGARPPALNLERWNDVHDPLDQMQLADARFYLPDDVLTKVDRASMNAGLEVRVPLLDPGLLAFGLSIPPTLRRNAMGGKAPLRALLERYLPRDLFERPKAGFGVPMAAWLRGPLREWADERLRDRVIDGLDGVTIQKAWSRHVSGAEDHAPALWAVIMLTEWNAVQRGAD